MKLSHPWEANRFSASQIPHIWRSILIISSHLCLSFPSGLFASGFPTKTLYTPLLSPIHAICPTHLILLDLITQIIFGEEYRSWSSSLCSLLHSPVTSSILGPYSQTPSAYVSPCLWATTRISNKEKNCVAVGKERPEPGLWVNNRN